ncbi:MAG: ERCC4 domain-containing protein [Planctomycetota bacterium]
MSGEAPEFVVVADTREQNPFAFEGLTGPRGCALKVAVCRAGLKTGDYSIRGLEDEIAVERKSKVDLYGTVGRGRGRFERELERLAVMRAPALVLECDLASILRPPSRSKVSPSSVLNSLIAWSVRHRIPVWPCQGRRFAEIVTFRLLQHYWADHMRRHEEGRSDAE